jgi:uncharacterized caspase-like protein
LNAIKQAGEAVAGENLTLVFFFSGHGFAVDGENYLATLDADSNNLATAGLNDACRDEPGKNAVVGRHFLVRDEQRRQDARG